MADAAPQPQAPTPKRDEKKTGGTPAQNNNNRNGPRRSNTPKQTPPGAPVPGPSPSPRPTNRRPSQNAGESGSDTSKKDGTNSRSNSRRGGRGGGGGGRGGNRNNNGGGGRGGRSNSANKDRATPGTPSAEPATASPSAIAPSLSDGSDALSNLQSLIADMKVTSPPSQAAPPPAVAQPAPISASSSSGSVSNLPPNAPPFQPGASMYPGLSGVAAAANHRKAVSLGQQGLSSNFNSYAPQFGGLMEDAEEHGEVYEEGEIRDQPFPQQQQQQQVIHHPRAQSQTFTAPRFAALAAERQQQQMQQQQQQQSEQEVMGQSGRPQLAPGFSFGKRPSVPMVPSISEEDIGFQFPQQSTPQTYEFEPPPQPQMNEQANRGQSNMSGLMAEQVRCLDGPIVLSVPSLTYCFTDCASKPNRSSSAAAAGSVCAPIGF